MKTATYRVTIRPTDESFAVRADTIERAATIAARRLYGRTVTAQRATGSTGKSGIFAAYRFDRRLHAETSVGSELHVGAVQS